MHFHLLDKTAVCDGCTLCLLAAVCMCRAQLVAYKWSVRLQAGLAQFAAHGSRSMLSVMLTQCIVVVVGAHGMYVLYLSRVP